MCFHSAMVQKRSCIFQSTSGRERSSPADQLDTTLSRDVNLFHSRSSSSKHTSSSSSSSSSSFSSTSSSSCCSSLWRLFRSARVSWKNQFLVSLWTFLVVEEPVRPASCVLAPCAAPHLFTHKNSSCASPEKSELTAGERWKCVHERLRN